MVQGESVLSVSVRRVRVVVAGVVVAAALAACSGDPEPTPTPVVTTEVASPTVVVEPEETPTPTATEATEVPVVRTERPALMDEDSDAGAIAAAEYFAVLAYETLRTLDVETWNLLYTDSCGFCGFVVESVEEAVASGNTFEGGVATVRGESRVVGYEETLGLVGVDVPISVTPQVMRSPEGEVLGEWPQAESYFYTELAVGYGGWQMVGAGTYGWAH